MKRIGPVLKVALLYTEANAAASQDEKAALRRAGLWDKEMERPSDRVAAIRMGGEDGLDRAYAMHQGLEPYAVIDTDAERRYAGLYIPQRYRRTTTRALQAIIQEWPTAWLRMVGALGGVPLVAALIALVAVGYDPPNRLADIEPLLKGLPTHSGSLITDWVIIGREGTVPS